MYAEATKYLFSLLVRISKISRRQLSRSGGEELYANDMALFALLFSQEQETPEQPLRIRMTDVSRSLMISKPAATQMVNHLVDMGLIERCSHESDRRVVYIQATREGQRVFQKKLENRLLYVERAVHRIGVKRSALLGELLDEFMDALVAVTEEDEGNSSSTEEQSKC